MQEFLKQKRSRGDSDHVLPANPNVKVSLAVLELLEFKLDHLPTSRYAVKYGGVGG